MRKQRCYKCEAMAVWNYVPGGDYPDNYYCDNCVNRGDCSCTIIDSEDGNADDQYRDEEGRLYPCWRYNYSECGFAMIYDYNEEEDLSYNYYEKI